MLLRRVCCLTSLQTWRRVHDAHGATHTCMRQTPPQLQRLGEAGARRLSASAAEAAGSDQPAPEAAVAPRVPLCERTAAHTAPLSAVLDWRAGALEELRGIGDSWLREDAGPSEEDLQTELGWLLDDAVAAVAPAGQPWQPTTWRQLERGLRLSAAEAVSAESGAGAQLRLREPLGELAVMWGRRVGQRVPLQYLTAAAYWRDVVLSVGPGVLIPRPETELLVDFVVESASRDPRLAAGAWADLGTGSGALACGIARALPAAQVWAVDLHAAPVAHAAFNAARLGVGGRVRVLQGSWYAPLAEAGVVPGGLAGVVSNPPYISAEMVPGLQAEVGRHEPRAALDGGAGPALDCLVPICSGAAAVLAPGGLLALETGGGDQAAYVAELLRHALEPSSAQADAGDGGGPGLAFQNVVVRYDMRGVARFVTACRRG